MSRDTDDGFASGYFFFISFNGKHSINNDDANKRLDSGVNTQYIKNEVQANEREGDGGIEEKEMRERRVRERERERALRERENA